MAGQVNTRFVIILSAVMVVLVGGAAVVLPMISRDVEDMVARGEQFVKEGDYERAVESLQIAINKSKNDPKIIQKYLEVAKEAPAADTVEANNTLRDVQQKTLALTQLDLKSEAYLRDYADLIKLMISKNAIAGGHRLIYQAAVARLDAEPEDKLARRYRGVYGLDELNPEMTEEDINRVRDDILWAQQAYPDDAEVIHGVARWKLFDADRLDRPGGDVDLAKSLRDEAVMLSQGLVDADPENTTRKIEHLQVLYQATRGDQDRDNPYAAIKPLLAEIEQRLLADPKPFTDVSMIERFIKTVYARDLAVEEDEEGGATSTEQNQGIVRSLALLERAAEANPDDVRYNLLLGVALSQANQFEEARPHIEKVKNLSTQGHYLDVLLHAAIKGTAEIEYVDLLISLSQFTDSEDERKSMYAEAEQLIEKFESSGRGESPRVLLLKGRLALAQNKVREGLINIDKAAEKYDAYSLDKLKTLLLSARARAQQGDWGSAAERYEQLLQANPNVPAVRLELARIYLRQRDLDKAQGHLDAVLIDDSGNERAKVLQASIQAARGDLDQAIKTYRELDLPNRPDLALGLAQLMIQGDRKPQAAAMLRHYFEAAPADLRLLSALLSVEEDIERKRDLIAQSRDAGGDPDTLNILEQQLDPEIAGDIERTVEMLVERQPDPFLREVESARLYARAGEVDKSREALARAVEINPDHKTVIDMRFSYALQDGDLALAQQLADQAALRNLDEAGGRFYLAQIHKARGDLSDAIDTLRAGLEVVPINSDGWRMLGDVYVVSKNDQDAILAYETSLKQKPDNLGSMRGLASIRDRQGRHGEALEMLRRSRDQYPNNQQLQNLYLGYEGRYGDKQLALRLRRELLSQQPENVNNIRALAMLLAETGKADEGVQMIRDLISKEGESQLNVVTLASVHRYAGNADQGAQTIRRYVQGRGTEADVADYLLLARYLLQINDGKGAFSAYQQAIGVESDQREASRELAGIFFSRTAFDRAVPLYRDLFAQFPEDDAIGMRLADALIRTEQYEEAEGVLDRVEGEATEDALRALLAEQRGEHAEAIRLINRAIETDAGRAVFHYERAALKSKDPASVDDVIQDLNTALSLDPTHLLSRRLLVSMYQRRGERNEAVRELTNMVARHPEYSGGRLMLIQMYSQEGNTNRAKALAREGLALSDTDPTWHAVLGDLAMREDDIEGAISSYKRVFELTPSAGQAGQLMKITTIQVENGRATDAQTMLRENADLVNPQPMLQAVMGRALYANGRPDEARQVFTRAVQACKGMDQFYGVALQIRKDYTLAETTELLDGLSGQTSPGWLGLTLARLELNENMAEQALSRARALEPKLSGGDTPERLALDQVMAAALHQTGEAEQALKYYERLIGLMPDDGAVLNNMAYLLAEDLGRPGDALPMAQRAAELSPKNAQVLDTLGWIHFKLGQIDEASRTLKNSIALESLSANHLHLAELLIGQGYRAEAALHLQTAIDLAEQTNETEMLERAQELLKQTADLTEAL